MWVVTVKKGGEDESRGNIQVVVPHSQGWVGLRSRLKTIVITVRTRGNERGSLIDRLICEVLWVPRDAVILRI